MTEPEPPSPADSEWIPFPGGELLGERPQVSCAACRRRAQDDSPEARGRTLCFQCYRVGLERRRQLAAALEGSAAPEERFQDIHPFEPVDRERLDRLRRTRLAVRAEEATGLSRFERQRRRAQIEARRALDSDAGPGHVVRRAELGRDDRVVAACVAGDLRMPTAWLPFLMSR